MLHAGCKDVPSGTRLCFEECRWCHRRVSKSGATQEFDRSDNFGQVNIRVSSDHILYRNQVGHRYSKVGLYLILQHPVSGQDRLTKPDTPDIKTESVSSWLQSKFTKQLTNFDSSLQAMLPIIYQWYNITYNISSLLLFSRPEGRFEEEFADFSCRKLPGWW